MSITALLIFHISLYFYVIDYINKYPYLKIYAFVLYSISMKNIVVVLFLVGILLMVGCTQNSSNASPEVKTSVSPTEQKQAETKPSELKTAVCGNGIKEAGETADNCCQDVECPLTFKCNSKFENNQTTYFCQKIEKKDTFESGKIKQLMADIGVEINKESGLRNYGNAKSKLGEIDTYSITLREKGYNTSTEEFMYKVAKARIETSEIRDKNFDGYETMTFEQKKTAVSKDLIDVTNLVDTLEAWKKQYANNLHEAEQIYGYNLDRNLDVWKSYQTQDTVLKENFEKGFGATISVLEVDKKCYRYSTIDDTAYLNGFSLQLDNTGGFDISNIRVDVTISSSGALVTKKSNNVIYGTLSAGQTSYAELSTYALSNLKCDKAYDVKLDLRRGADPEVLGTTTVKVVID